MSGQRPEGYAEQGSGGQFRVAPASRRGGWAAIRTVDRFKRLVNKEITGAETGGEVAPGESLPPVRFLVALGIPVWTRLGLRDCWGARRGKLAVSLAVATTGWAAWLRERHQRELRGQIRGVKTLRNMFILTIRHWNGEGRELENR